MIFLCWWTALLRAWRSDSHSGGHSLSLIIHPASGLLHWATLLGLPVWTEKWKGERHPGCRFGGIISAGNPPSSCIQ